MSFGTHGANAIPDRLSCDYAPTDRASCKACGGGIGKDSVRIGEKVRSPWHDGFDTRMTHSRCGLRLGNAYDDFKGFQRLRWKDQVELAEKLSPGCTAPETVESKRVQRLNEMVWEVKTALAAVPKKALFELVQLNGVFASEKATPPALLHGIADGIVCGMLPTCPWCSGRSLELEGTLLRCYGYANGATHCTYKSCVTPEGTPDLFGRPSAPNRTESSLLVRERPWTLTPTIERALKGWTLPTDAPVRQLPGGGGPAAPAISGAAASAAAPKGRGKKRKEEVATTDDAESADEAGEVPDTELMLGLAFASVGSTSPSSSELQALVEKCGGVWVSGSIGDGSVITHLVSTEAEARKAKGKRTAKYEAALSGGVPIVSAQYVLDLARTTPLQQDDGDDDVVEVKPTRKSGDKRARPAERAEVIVLDSSDEEAAAAADVEDVGKLKVAELRVRLEARGLDSDGKKPELVERLRSALTTEGPPAIKKPRLARASAPAASSSAAAASAPAAPFGAALRQRKHMSSYLLDGPLGPRLPELAKAREHAAMRAAAAATLAPAPRRRLPPIEPGSALVTASADSGLSSARVYVDSYNLAYNVTLNQMDIRSGINKFYKMQLLVHGGAARPKYSVWKAWGRVGGEEGGDADHRFGRTNASTKHGFDSDLDAAVKEFEKKFRELACQPFVSCEPPCQAPGGYHVNLIPGQSGKDATLAAREAARAKVGLDRAASSAAAPSSRLEPAVREFVETIFSEKMMKAQLEAMSLDLDKMPLGAITDRQAERGYELLCSIADALKAPLADGAAQAERLLALTNGFYNVIPHRFARAATPPVITTPEMLVAKLEAMEALLQVGAAQSIAGSMAAEHPNLHPADVNYAKLGCALEPASASEVELVRKYAAQTHAATHDSYSMTVKHVFRARRDSEEAAFKGDKVGNRMLLWHGSRLTNWVGILSQGLRIAPPEAPATGYMFGKGVYFADMSSKSANYCQASRDAPTAVLVLCDVACGEQYERIANEYEAVERSVATRKHSTWGIGKHCPDPEGTVSIDGGKLKVPCGVAGKNAYLEDNLVRLKEQGAGKRSELLYNEFIVYDTAQVRMKYVVVVDVNFH